MASGDVDDHRAGGGGRETKSFDISPPSVRPRDRVYWRNRQSRRGLKMRVMSYNILAPCNIEKSFGADSPVVREHLAWELRRKWLWEEIEWFRPQLALLQEAHAEDFEEFEEKAVEGVDVFGEGGGRQGCLFTRRDADGGDGVATIWDLEMFGFVDFVSFQFGRGCEVEGYERLRKKSPGHVVLLEVKKGGRKKRYILVGNVHLVFSPSAGGQKLAQLWLMFRAAQGLKDKYGLSSDCPLLLAGDLNSTPASAVYDWLTAGPRTRARRGRGDFGTLELGGERQERSSGQMPLAQDREDALGHFGLGGFPSGRFWRHKGWELLKRGSTTKKDDDIEPGPLPTSLEEALEAPYRPSETIEHRAQLIESLSPPQSFPLQTPTLSIPLPPAALVQFAWPSRLCITHPFAKLISTYSIGASSKKSFTGEPPFTAFSAGQYGQRIPVDYIMVQPQLHLEARFEIPGKDTRKEIQTRGGLPVPHWGSDHFSLVVDLIYQ